MVFSVLMISCFCVILVVSRVIIRKFIDCVPTNRLIKFKLLCMGHIVTNYIFRHEGMSTSVVVADGSMCAYTLCACVRVYVYVCMCTAWCSEIGSLMSLDAPE